MELNLSGKVALVCASSKGIGKGIAVALAKEGVNVSILGRNEESLRKTEVEIKELGKGKVCASICDLNNEKEIERAFQKTIDEFGTVHILINNQGGPAPGNFEKISMEDTENAINLSLLSVLRMNKLCIPEMTKNGYGRILNILSIHAKEPAPNMLLSSMVRPAVVALGKCMAHDYADQGITVNSLLPSAVLSDRTDFFVNKKASDESISYDEALAKISEGLPSKKIATPEEFAQMAVFLSSPNASYINGTTICVDAGLTKGLF